MVNKSSEKSFTEINLTETSAKKAPKRLVYFSDGVLEEYSSEDEVDIENTSNQTLVDPKTLPWLPYFRYMFWMLGSRTLAVCDYLGEHLAWFLGITSPKFQYELEQFQKMMKEEEELKKHIKAENAGWCTTTTEDTEQTPEAVALQPQSKTPDILVNQDIESFVPFEKKPTLSKSYGKF